MHRIDTSTATSEGKFTDGDVSQAIAATQLNASWFNAAQEELANAIEKSGVELSADDDSQLSAQLHRFYTIETSGATVDLTENDRDVVYVVCGNSPTDADTFTVTLNTIGGKLPRLIWIANTWNSVVVEVTVIFASGPITYASPTGASLLLVAANKQSTETYVPHAVSKIGGAASFGSVVADSVKAGTVNVKAITGANAGSTADYVIIDNATVTGDLDVKGSANLGGGLVSVNHDDQKAEVTGDLAVSGKITATAIAKGGSQYLDVTGETNFGDKMTASEIAVGDLTVTGTVNLAAGSNNAPTEIHWTSEGKGSTLTSWSSSSGVFILLINDGSNSFAVTYNRDSSNSAISASKSIAAGTAALFYQWQNGGSGTYFAAPVG